jgi:hypothetical protein
MSHPIDMRRSRDILFSAEDPRSPQMILVRDCRNFRKLMKGGGREIYSIID